MNLKTNGLTGMFLADLDGSTWVRNIWLWIAILEFCVIILLIFRAKLFGVRDVGSKFFAKKSLGENIDFDNVINSSFNSNPIFDELKIRCHPDRFPNDEVKRAIAQNIFQEAVRNRLDVKKLLLLKEEARQKLNIEF
jgi:hypothetical protein